MNSRRILFLASVVAVLVTPGVAFANAGVPMIAIVSPGMGVLLVPVIVLEVVVLRRLLDTKVKPTVIAVAVSNLVSTVVGVPLTWAALVGLQMLTGGGGSRGPSFESFAGKLLSVTWQAPWLMPYETDLYWMVPVAALVLFVPFFFVSWLIEYRVSLLFMRTAPKPELKRAVFVANLTSYALLAGVTLVGLGAGIYQHVVGG